MLKTMTRPFQWWVDKIRSERPFTFVRYGDGELNAMFWCGRKKGGGRTKNGDFHTLRSPELRRLLKKSITQPGAAQNYYRSLWLDQNGRPRERLARDHLSTVSPEGVTWWNALAIQAALNAGRGHAFFQAMRGQERPIVLVGPEHLRKVNKAGCFNYAKFVQVPYRRAFFARERIVEDALEVEGPALYSVHAGPASPVIAWMLWKERGDVATVLDLGSILDGYPDKRFGGPGQGKMTRSFWKKRATKAIIQRNLHG